MSEPNRSGKLSHLPNRPIELRDRQLRDRVPHARECVPRANVYHAWECVPRANAYHGGECVPRANACHTRKCLPHVRIWTTRTIAYRHVPVNYQFGLSADMIGTNANSRTRPIFIGNSISENRSVLSVLQYRPNGSTEPIGNSERVGLNRPKHAIYRFGSNRESVLDRPNASSVITSYTLHI